MAARTVHLALRLVTPLRVRIAVIFEDVVVIGFAVHPDYVVLRRAFELDEPQLGLVPVEAVSRGGVAPGPTAIRKAGWKIPHLEDAFFFVVEHRLTDELHISSPSFVSALFPGPVRHHDGIAGVFVGPEHVAGDAVGFVDEQVVEEVLLAVSDIDDAGCRGGGGF